MLTPLDRALQMAILAHTGQLDKGGEPYILHPIRVMFRCEDGAPRVVALLHDTVEDSAFELSDIADAFGDEIAEAVDAMTRREGEDYPDFIVRCGKNPIAKQVKIQDLQDNMDITRIGRRRPLNDADHERFRKYHRALTVLRPWTPPLAEDRNR